ncbi:hypothetical protein AB0J86_00475 [Micromonospora sp. NPDC049559]|uniref:hypothetical protein n=1 Tax=Micromonospora sp. NPDC049559 TaxID=3155923 RepID=UPI0034414BDB
MSRAALACAGEHTPRRPLWLCRADGQPWPCGPARVALARQARRDRVPLILCLAADYAEAVRDLYSLNPETAPEPATLFARFLSCVPPRDRPAPDSPGDLR